jgi:hypothetical protein
MGEKIQLKGGISEVKFGYHSKMGGYMMLMPDIPGLYEIVPLFYWQFCSRLCGRFINREEIQCLKVGM